MLIISLEEALKFECEKEVVMGAEMEIYVIDNSDDYCHLLNDEYIIEDIYNEFDDRVYRDYYEYQLEIRTNPSDDWKEVADELIELMSQASKVAREYDCFIAPVSFLKGAMFNGFHVHVSYKPEMSFRNMVEHAFAMYPFMFDVARLTLSSPIKDNRWGEILSLRQIESPHIGVPPLHYTNDRLEDYWVWDEDARGSNRYHDIIINTSRKEGRHRVKSTDTIEVRMFDCVGSKRHLRVVLEMVYKIAKYINPEWFNKYRQNYSFMVRLRNLLENMKYLIVQRIDWINPLTMHKISELQDYLNLEDYREWSWISVLPIFQEYVCVPESHKDISYPIP